MTKLKQDALILGKLYLKNTKIEASEETINQGYKNAQKQRFRQKITKVIADTESLLGTTADATAYNLDDTAMDILAVSKSTDSSYKKQRIKLYNQLHGDDAWDRAVTAAQAWFNGRTSKKIKLTVDVKGVDTVIADVATRSTKMTQLLEGEK